MFTLRCTGKLLKRLGGPTEIASPIEPSTKLGDWYAHLLFTRPQLVLCVSERTLLPVLVPARDASALVPRLREAVGTTLRALGVSATDVSAEEQEMTQVIIGKTASRQVLGSMNDFVRMLDVYLSRHETLLDVFLHLAETPCGPLRMSTPHDETIRVFATLQ
jgi:hypothetical protein